MSISHIPATRHNRWIWLTQFLNEWCPPRRTSLGHISATRLDVAESRLGYRLPTAVREWYLQFGNRSDLWCAQDKLLPPELLRIDGDLLVFLTECQGVVQWGIPVHSLNSEMDPIVSLDMCDLGDESHAESCSFSEFVVALALYDLKFVGEDVAAGSANMDLSGPLTKALFRQAPLTAWHWPKVPTTFSIGDNSVIEVQGPSDETCWITLTSKNQQSLVEDLKRLRSHGIVLSPVA